MTTIVNNPTPSTGDSGGNSMVIGFVLLIVFAVLLIYFGIPAIRRMTPVQLNVPAAEVNIPDSIDVNVNQAK